MNDRDFKKWMASSTCMYFWDAAADDIKTVYGPASKATRVEDIMFPIDCPKCLRHLAIHRELLDEVGEAVIELNCGWCDATLQISGADIRAYLCQEEHHILVPGKYDLDINVEDLLGGAKWLKKQRRKE